MEIGRWKGVDPVYQASESPYASMGNNPVSNIDPKGDVPTNPHEYEVDGKTGKKKKVSDMGGDGVDFNHYVGGEKNGKTEIVNTKTGETQIMSNSRNIANYTRRDKNVSWVDIYGEYKLGYGPEKSLFYGDHNMNRDILKSPNFVTAMKRYKNSGSKKFGTSPFFDPITPGLNMTSQMLGKANYNFYEVGDKTVVIVIDSKSKSSESINPLEKSESMNVPRINGKATPESTTHQTYLFIMPTNFFKTK